jgi:prepilin-type N-terminal cleavage/methylation domain-containing protein
MGHRRGFTLVELLVVMVIILAISVVALPSVIHAIGDRQMGEAARLVQASLAGARDAAIHANAPRGIRLLPDPAFAIARLSNGQLDPADDGHASSRQL